MGRRQGRRHIGWRRKRTKEQGGLCAICGEPFGVSPRLAASLDHIVPLSKGGPDTYENVQAAHEKCNRDKADKEE